MPLWVSGKFETESWLFQLQSSYMKQKDTFVILNLSFIQSIIMPAIYLARIFLDPLIYWMLNEKIGFASWRIKQNDLVTILLYMWRCMCCFSFYPWKTRKILVLLIVRAMPLLFLLRGKLFHRAMCAISLTNLLSKLVCPETKGEGKSEIKRNNLSCHQIWHVTNVVCYLVLWS